MRFADRALSGRNQSAKASVSGAMSDLIPCGLVAVDMTERPDMIIDGAESTLKLGWGRKWPYINLDNTR